MIRRWGRGRRSAVLGWALPFVDRIKSGWARTMGSSISMSEIETTSTTAPSRGYLKAWTSRLAIAGAIALIAGSGMVVQAELNRATFDLVDDYSPVWSPRGDRIAFVRQISNPCTGYEHSELHMVRPDGKGDVAIASAGQVVGQLKWAPDGERIAFLSAARRLDAPDLVIVEPSTRAQLGPFKIAANPEWEEARSLEWSPNGELVAVVGYNSTIVHIFTRDGHEFARVAVSPVGLADIAWSSESDEVLLLPASGPPRIEIVNLDGQVREIPISAGDIRELSDPQWSPRGGLVAVRASVPEPNYLAPSRGQVPKSRVWIVDPNHGQSSVLTEGAIAAYAWMEGGEALQLMRLRSLGDRDWELGDEWVCGQESLMGWGPTMIPEVIVMTAVSGDFSSRGDLAPAAISGSWSPDRNRIAFSTVHGNHSRIEIGVPGSSATTPVTIPRCGIPTQLIHPEVC